MRVRAMLVVLAMVAAPLASVRAPAATVYGAANQFLGASGRLNGATSAVYAQVNASASRTAQVLAGSPPTTGNPSSGCVTFVNGSVSKTGCGPMTVTQPAPNQVRIVGTVNAGTASIAVNMTVTLAAGAPGPAFPAPATCTPPQICFGAQWSLAFPGATSGSVTMSGVTANRASTGSIYTGAGASGIATP